VRVPLLLRLLHSHPRVDMGDSGSGGNTPLTVTCTSYTTVFHATAPLPSNLALPGAQPIGVKAPWAWVFGMNGKAHVAAGPIWKHAYLVCESSMGSWNAGAAQTLTDNPLGALGIRGLNPEMIRKLNKNSEVVTRSASAFPRLL
jgi:hypothetical protein